MANNKKQSNEANSTNDGLALVVGGLFVLALVFATYSYFNKSASVVTDTSDTKGISTSSTKDDDDSELSLTERIKELFNSNSVDTTGDVNGNGASTTNEDKEVMAVSEMNNETMTNEYQWVANDYTQGEITGNSYIVKDGDTLWEIAEAKYGDGTAWTKILEANSAEIGYLTNGQQALIFAGQSLTLP